MDDCTQLFTLKNTFWNGTKILEEWFGKCKTQENNNFKCRQNKTFPVKTHHIDRSPRCQLTPCRVSKRHLDVQTSVGELPPNLPTNQSPKLSRMETKLNPSQILEHFWAVLPTYLPTYSVKWGIFFLNGHSETLFSFVCCLSNNNIILQHINVKNHPSSIWCWVLNS